MTIKLPEIYVIGGLKINFHKTRSDEKLTHFILNYNIIKGYEELKFYKVLVLA